MKIKFRAWDKEEKYVVTGDDEQGSILGEEGGYFDLRVFPERYEIMQFTGLKDKNGKEIYEGDILGFREYTLPQHKGVWTVKWNAYCWDIIRQFKGLWEGDKGIGCFEGEEKLWRLHDRMEVIGNIYENPELTTSKTKNTQEEKK